MGLISSKRFFFSQGFVWAVTVFVLFIALLLFFNFLINLSVPDQFDSVHSVNIKSETNIYFNNFGIPHIVGKHEGDVFFAMGYVHARDRLFQMDILRRTASGRLSEIFGSETIEIDKFFKSLSLNNVASKSLKLLDKPTMNALAMYSAGINKFIGQDKNIYPFEFSALDYSPDLWTPLHSLLIAKLMAFDMSPAFINDICLAEISERKGVRNALSLIQDYPENAPCITDLDYSPKIPYSIWNDTNQTVKPQDSVVAGAVYESINNFLQSYSAVSASGGSNSWVVRKNSENKNVILANDPHLKLSLPSYWYQMHVSCKEFNTIGLTIPGAPFFLIGRNDAVAWGITVMMLDDCDFFIERIDETNKNYYLTPTGKKKFKFRADTIKIKNQQPLYYYSRLTDNSAIISDNYIMKNPRFLIGLDKDSSMSFGFYDKFMLSFKWTGSVPDKSFNALYKLLKTKNWSSFNNALDDWSAPGLNWSYADINGNMGIRPAGLIPKRKNTNPLIPNPGWLTDYQWDGYELPAVMPRIYNPPKGYVVSANNKTSRDNTIHLSDYYEPPARVQRIEEIIITRQQFNVRNVQIMQLDNYSNYADELLFYAIPIFDKEINRLDRSARKALALLKKWDRVFSPAYAAPSVFNSFYKHLNSNVFLDDMGQRLWRTYNYIPQFAHQKLLNIVKYNDSQWFDDVRTSKKEDRTSILIKSLNDACSELAGYFKSNNIYSWKLSEIQILELKHPFSQNKFLKSSVDGGKYIMPGNFTAVNKADWIVYSDYKVLIGSSARFIADMQDSVVYWSILGGAAGDPMRTNYKDQALFFINGGYVKSSARSTPARDALLKLQLLPE